MAYIIKITDLTGEGKPDLYYTEPKDMRRALVADINQAKKYATEEEAYNEIDDSDIAELVIDYGYYNWESDEDGNVDFVDEVPGDAIDIITESKSLKDIRKQMNKLVEDISGNEKYYIKEKDNYSGSGYLSFSPLKNHPIQPGILGEPVVMTYNFNEARAFDTYEEAEKVAEQLISRTKAVANDNLKDDRYKDFDNVKIDYTLSIINQKGNVIKTFSYTTINKNIPDDYDF